MGDRIEHDPTGDGIDRRGFLKCMAWAGTGVLFTIQGGLLRSYGLSALSLQDATAAAARADLSFVQISDSHIGFSKEANQNVTATLQEALAKIDALPTPPAFLIHTGDISHLSKPEQFDTVDQALKGAKIERAHFVPGEHDVLVDGVKPYLERYGKGAQGSGWYSFDQKGVHFIGLVNVLDLKAGGLGHLGTEQLEWLQKDVAKLSASTPIVVFAHVPLWSVYPEWGWGTEDSAQALSYLKRFGSVTVLNGHIHQVMQKVEGNITFHTAMSTAFPQPQPGKAPSPGPMTVPADKLRGLLGLTSVQYIEGKHSLAIVDTTLAGSVAARNDQVHIDNFRFTPDVLHVSAGAQVTWSNRDDMPHTVVSADKLFTSPALDTDERFSYRFDAPGAYAYYCSLHPKMTGKVIVS